MSERLYYDNAYTTVFSARIVERVETDGNRAIVLDGTYFYPTSGGQPHDRGVINGVPVVDVVIRDKDGAILHRLGDGYIDSDDVKAEIDWKRRFDHMQQHSGQHILSQAFLQVAGAQTVGFHLSADTVTIDLDAAEVSQPLAAKAELLANEIIWENRPIRARMVTFEEADKLPLRKLPPARNDKLRLIEIDDFDLSACGGTHVAMTGEIGIIKVIKAERRGEQVRVGFRCGKRALRDYDAKNRLVVQLTTELTTGYSEIVGAVSRLREENKQARRTIKKQENELLRFQAERLLGTGRRLGNANIVSQVLSEGDPGTLRTLANQLTENEGVVALLGLAGAKAQLVFSRAEDAPGDMGGILREALEFLGSAARGGGNDAFAQGGGPAADRETVAKAIEKAERRLLHKL